MFHASQAVLALSREENPTVFQKTLGLNDFYFGSGEFEYPLGNIQMVGKSQARDVPRRAAGRDEAGPGVGMLDRARTHAIDFWLSTEDLPLPENRVTVDRGWKAHALLHADERLSRRSSSTPSSRSILGKLDMNS